MISSRSPMLVMSNGDLASDVERHDSSAVMSENWRRYYALAAALRPGLRSLRDVPRALSDLRLRHGTQRAAISQDLGTGLPST